MKQLTFHFGAAECEVLKEGCAFAEGFFKRRGIVVGLNVIY